MWISVLFQLEAIAEPTVHTQTHVLQYAKDEEQKRTHDRIKKKESLAPYVLSYGVTTPEEDEKRIMLQNFYQWKEGHISKEKLFIRNHGHKKMRYENDPLVGLYVGSCRPVANSTTDES